jgi:hypothetical protein
MSIKAWSHVQLRSCCAEQQPSVTDASVRVAQHDLGCRTGLPTVSHSAPAMYTTRRQCLLLVSFLVVADQGW